MKRNYTLYGLRVESEVELPEIAGSEVLVDEEPIVIERGHVPEELRNGRKFGSSMQVADNLCLYEFPGAGRYLVEGGRRIVVAAQRDAAANDVRAFLFGSVMGTLLHQRGLLPMHISAVVSSRGVIAFTGPSGAGKSTTAAIIHQQKGWPILCDDVAVVRMTSGKPVLSAGLVRLKLWKDALNRLDIHEHGLDRDLLRFDKFHVSAPNMFAGDTQVLQSLFELAWGDNETLEPLKGVDAFRTVMAAVYRPYLADLVGDRALMTANCMAVAKKISVARLTRPKDHSHIQRLELESTVDS
ncbi:hypothetical protein N8I71_13825 [Roseibacterium sp. SDUM158016]|uniref:hypothetical protein n=1 Tax=Roseicyclus sediminis TaxID=2980997 RepID=UPI0021D2BCF7|nr:hypothetical protein [Roseibacterium sp. SDUM158016]MCU4653919.1 hypothetical protein [Roseibacterium sp. SDUM158016]